MPKEIHGAYMIFCPGVDNVCRKIFEIKIIRKLWPVITFEEGQTIYHINKDGKIKDLKEFQHMSFPPDLRIHLTPKNATENHIFLLKDIVDSKGALKVPESHLVTFLSRPFNQFKPQRKVMRRKGAIISIHSKDRLFTQQTGLFVDVFAHQNRADFIKIIKIPLVQIKEPRFLYDNSNNTIVSFETINFRELIETSSSNLIPNFYLTFRYGYWESNLEYDLLIA